MSDLDPLNPKDRAGQSKPQMGLIPHAALVEVARVMESGAVKYGPYNWRRTPVGYMAYLNAAERHRGVFQDGQDQDTDTGRSHLAHLAATALILLDAIITGNAKDDRPPKNPAYVEPDPVKPVLSGGLEEAVQAGLTYDIPICGCERCVETRKIKARMLPVEKPTDGSAADKSRAGEKAAP